jgi:type I restriction enzyme, S subunit
MGEWIETSLDTLAIAVTRGVSPKYSEIEGIPVINQKCIRNGKIDLALARIHDTNKRFSSEKLLKNGDILINSTGVGTAGRVAIFDEPKDAICDSHVSILRLNADKYFPKLVFYNLRGREKEIEETAEGSTGQIELSREGIRSLELSIPNDKEEQRAIAEVLSSLDDKIDLLHRQIKTLESLAQALLRKCFLESDGRTGQISEILEFNPTRKLPKGIPATYLEMANLGTTMSAPNGWRLREFTSGMKFQNGDALLARITPCLENGKAAFVNFLADKEVGWGSTEFIVMRSRFGYHPLVAYLFARNLDFKDFAIANMSGSSGRQRVDPNHLKDYECTIPSRDDIDYLNRNLEQFAPKLRSNLFQIMTLEKLRETLLPKLMSGEVRVDYEAAS